MNIQELLEIEESREFAVSNINSAIALLDRQGAIAVLRFVTERIFGEGGPSKHVAIGKEVTLHMSETPVPFKPTARAVVVKTTTAKSKKPSAVKELTQLERTVAFVKEFAATEGVRAIDLSIALVCRKYQASTLLSYAAKKKLIRRSAPGLYFPLSPKTSKKR